MSFSKSIVTPLLLILLALGACKQKGSEQPEAQKTEYNEFVRAYSSGLLKSDEGMLIRFADLAHLNDLNPAALISVNPEISGQASWKDQRTLEFFPDEKWESGQTYTVTVFLNKIPNLEKTQSDFSFSFDIIKNSYTLEEVRLITQDDEDLNVHQIEGVLQLADQIAIEKIEKALQISRDRKKYNVVWKHFPDEYRHVFRVENIQRENHEFDVVLQVEGEHLEIEADWQKRIHIPATGTFLYLTHRVFNGQEQYVEVDFSDPLDVNQDMRGLVKFNNATSARYVIEGNQLKIFPQQRLLGEVALTIFSHLENIKNQRLNKNTDLSLLFLDEKPKVALLKKGAVVPRSEGLKFPFKAVNVRAVRLRIAQILEDNVAFFLQRNELDGRSEIKRAARLVYNDILHLKTDDPIDFGVWNNYSFNLEQYVDVEPGAIYKVYLTIERAYSLYPCASDSVDSEQIAIQVNWNSQFNESDANYWNYYDYAPEVDWRHYNYQEAENPCKPSYYLGEAATVSQSIFASDLGIIAKAGGDNKLHVAVSDILSTQSKSGVKIDAYTFQHTHIGGATTNKDGFCLMELSGQPYLLIAREGADYGYLRLDDGSVKSVSMFQVEGQKNTNQVKAFIYGERGVWRPGDSIYLQSIIQDKRKQLPPDHPIVFELYNSRGQLANRQVRSFGNKNMHDFRLRTKLTDPTGNWRAQIRIGDNEFSKTIRIETVKPNRLKMDFDFPSDIIKVVNGEIRGKFNSQWLHGAKANGLKADIKLKIRSGLTIFENYNGFRFDDDTKKFNPSEKIIFNNNLNENGEADFKSKINTRHAPGMLSAQFTSRVFEKGGEFSIDRKSLNLSPYSTYVGMKIPKGSGWRGAIQSGDSKVVNLALISHDGRPVSGKVELKIYGLSWRWWYDHDRGRDMTSFMRNRENKLVKTEIIEINNGEAFYSLPELRGFGNFMIIARHIEGGHSSSNHFRYWWGMESNDVESAKMLQFEVSKSTYQVEEKIQVDIPSNGEGHFIVSLESANRVVEWKRIKALPEKTSVSFFADPSLVPNAYVYVAYLQPHAQTANDLPIRMYGVQPIFIENKSTHLTPVLDMSEDWKPEETVDIIVSEDEGKAMDYTLAIVDEGLLQLTRFNTPDPWSALHQKEALAVQTWDLYDDIIGAHAGEMAGLLAIGGDGSIAEVGGVKANRFPPMVRFIGSFSLDKNEKQTHTVTLPNYVGQVRVMAIAATDRAYGKAAKSIEVKKPLMVLASLPRVVGPGETVSLPVTTFAMEDNIKQVNVSVRSGKLFNIQNYQRNIQFSQTGDQVIYFPVKVANQIGTEKIQVIAEGHGQRATYEVEIDVRPSNPPVHSTKNVVIEPGGSELLNFSLPGIEGTNSLAIEATIGLTLDFGNKADYLFGYPHGCIEQTTSKAFPQLFLSGLIEVSEEEQKNVDNNIKHGIDRLYSFQLSNGGLGYWPNATTASPWGTSYAGHFMLEAQRLGYVLPPGFLKNWIQYQKTVANNWLPKKYGVTDHGYRWSHELMQAYRLYTLALAGAPQVGAMNRLRAEVNLSLQATWRLALTYHLIGHKEVAINMIANASLKVEPYKNYGRTFGSSIRDRSMILESLVEMKRWDQAQNVAEKIAEDLQSASWYSTQSTAYSFLSLFKFLGDKDPAPLTFSYSIDDQQEINVANNDKFYYQKIKDPEGLDHSIKISNKGEKRLFIQIHTGGIPLEGKEERSNKNLKMDIAYYNMTGKKINPVNLTRGNDFIAYVTLRNVGTLGDYKEMALTQIFPSGWEIHNTRLDNIPDDIQTNKPDYLDIRDDRVYTYFDLPASREVTYKVKLTATYPGRFYQPAVFCEAMYDRDIYALEPGRWVNISDQ